MDMIFYSHVRKGSDHVIIPASSITLKQHLSTVGKAVRNEIKETLFSNEIDKETLSRIGFLVAISHDFGKYTRCFQDKLIKGIDSNKADHSLVSALFCFYLLNRFVDKNALDRNENYRYVPLIGFQMVKHHHGNLVDISRDVDIGHSRGILKSQVEDLRDHISLIEPEINGLLEDTVSFEPEDFFKLFDIEEDEERSIIENDLMRTEYHFNKPGQKKELKFYYFILHQYLFSLLIAGDKIAASGVRTLSRQNICFSLVEKFRTEEFNITGALNGSLKRKELNQRSLNEVRESIYRSVLSKLDDIDLDRDRVFTLTAPTGTGKTLTAFAAALKIREHFGNIKKLRIIYSLPFTGIIEQNYEVIEKILKKIPGFEGNESPFLLKHHYFTNTRYKVDNERIRVEDASMYLENWESEIIITTFIQFFYTLIGYKNRTLKKFNRFANSIIILDEIQNIPVKYWKLVNLTLKLISYYFNSFIILLTATKPLIFEERESIELLTDNEAYFRCPAVNRTKLIITDISTIDRLIMEIKAQQSEANSIMVILNTIRCTIEVFERIIADNDFSDFAIIYLSTNITPFERKKRIKKIKEITGNNGNLIIITTQLIEAGVDIDVDTIFRDLGPLDSIIQAAGRANRNGEKGISRVFIMQLKDERSKNRRLFSSYIYDRIAVDEVTKPLLNNDFEEKEYLKLINDYFRKMKELKSTSESLSLLKSIADFHYYDPTPDKRVPIANFKLIETLPNYVSLFVELNKCASNVWKRYEDLKNENDIFNRKAKFQGFKGDFYNYIISIPEKCVAVCKTVRVRDDLYYLSRDNIRDNELKIYDDEPYRGTGYRRELDQWFF